MRSHSASIVGACAIIRLRALQCEGFVTVATYRKRRGKWQVQVRLRGALPQSRTFETKAAAQVWAKRLEREIDDGLARGGVAATGTLAELITRYEREIDPIKRFGRTKASSLRIIQHGLGSVRLRDLDAAAVIRFARARQRAGLAL